MSSIGCLGGAVCRLDVWCLCRSILSDDCMDNPVQCQYPECFEGKPPGEIQRSLSQKGEISTHSAAVNLGYRLMVLYEVGSTSAWHIFHCCPFHQPNRLSSVDPRHLILPPECPKSASRPDSWTSSSSSSATSPRAWNGGTPRTTGTSTAKPATCASSPRPAAPDPKSHTGSTSPQRCATGSATSTAVAPPR